MKRLVFTLIFSFILINGWSQSFKVYSSFDDFQTEILDDKKPKVINFWATWCKPCVEELPYFMEWYHSQKNKNIELILVSLDMKDNIKGDVIPFLKKHNYNVRNVVLTDGKQYKWIDKVSPEWSGSIPATLLINGNKKSFFEKEYHSSKELKNDIRQIFK